MNRKIRSMGAAGLVVALAIVTSACEGDGSSSTNTAAQKTVTDGFTRLQAGQPIPVFPFSQYRQSLIDIETMQAQGTASTSMFMLEGIGMMYWCPSMGQPLSAAAELSPSQAYVDIPDDNSNQKFPVDQGETTGIYPAATDGTNVICLDDNGKKFNVLWEGKVAAVTGVISGLDPAKRMMIDGDPTYDFGSQTPG